jgi:hypothetical protein
VDADAVQRFARQIALPEIGAAGQERLCAARVAVVGAGLTAEVVARYLAAAGVGTMVMIGASDNPALEAAMRASNPAVTVAHQPWPGADGDDWVAALEGAALVVRSGFDDDPMLRAAQRLGIPAVITAAGDDVVDVLSFPNPRPSPEVSLQVATTPRRPAPAGAAAVVAATLAAAEAVRALAGAGAPPEANARHLRLPLDGGPIKSQDIPWGSK